MERSSWAALKTSILRIEIVQRAIRGLLPHGPHNVRDVRATPILKVTGSHEPATTYAIQDTPEMVSIHDGRFLPQARAAQILNQVWEAA